MEWVETTGPTVAAAKEAALDQLGVDEAEAEFEVVEEAKNGLFGRVRREARVRARVQPRVPRPKVERRRSSRGNRNGRSAGSSDRDGKNRGTRSGGRSAAKSQRADAGPSSGADGSGSTKGGRSSKPERSDGERADKKSPTSRPRQSRSGRSADTTAKRSKSDQPAEETKVSEPVNVQEQGQMVRGFLEGLADAFDLDGEVSVTEVDDDIVEVTLDGDDLGLMIGPKGQTLQAIQELSRASVQRAADGPLEGRVRIDIGAYREKRREALGRFATQQAQEVLDTGVELGLEPMNAADRKVVHDTVNEIAGVRTLSEGEDARRRVVILPD